MARSGKPLLLCPHTSTARAPSSMKSKNSSDTSTMKFCRRLALRPQLEQLATMYLHVIKALEFLRWFVKTSLNEWRDDHWLLLPPKLVLAEYIVRVLLGQSTGFYHFNLTEHKTQSVPASAWHQTTIPALLLESLSLNIDPGHISREYPHHLLEVD